MLGQFNLKKAICDFYSLTRLIDGKSFRQSRKAVAESGEVDFTSVRYRTYYFKYKSLRGVIFQDSNGKMQINDFLFVLDGFSNNYLPFCGIEHLSCELKEVS